MATGIAIVVGLVVLVLGADWLLDRRLRRRLRGGSGRPGRRREHGATVHEHSVGTRATEARDATWGM